MDSLNKKLSKREKRFLNQNKDKENKTKLIIKQIVPITNTQKDVFSSYKLGKHLMLHGMAGTGKSFLSIYLSLNDVMINATNEEYPYKKVVIVRSVVPTRDMGFLPGTSKEKTKVYEAPYYAICTELFGRTDSYDTLKNKGVIEFISTSFIRGITLNDSIVVVDEMQNMTLQELDSIITRIGKNCKIIFCGDFRQTDFIKDYDKKGLGIFMKIIQKLSHFHFIDFLEEDIVRSQIVKQYLIQKNKLGVIL